jgi:hypothetical protein
MSVFVLNEVSRSERVFAITFTSDGLSVKVFIFDIESVIFV